MPSEHKLHVQVANPELVTGFLLYIVYELNLCTYQCQAQGGGGRATQWNLTVTYIPGVGILIGHHGFDLSISNTRGEVNHLFLLILTIIVCPAVGILIIFFLKNVKIPTLCPPPPLGLDIDRCIISVFNLV